MKNFLKGLAVGIVSFISVAVPTGVAFGAFTQYGLPGIYNATPFTLTDGQGSAISTNARGEILISPSSSINITSATTTNLAVTGQFSLPATAFALETVNVGNTARTQTTSIFSDRIGINSSSPIASLAVQGKNTLNPMAIVSSSGASLLTVLTNGYVGIAKTIAPFAGRTLDVNGTIFVGTNAANATLYGGYGLTESAGHALVVIEGTSGRTATLSLESGAVAGGPHFYMNTDQGTVGKKTWLLSQTNANALLITNNSEITDTRNYTAFSADANGNVNLNNYVGINSSTPSASLAIQTTSTINPFVIASSTGGDLFAIKATGDVVIGTPDTSLAGKTFDAEVSVLRITRPTGATAVSTLAVGTTNLSNAGRGVEYSFSESGTNGGTILVYDRASSAHLPFQIQSSKLSLSNNAGTGNVGIGTSSPDSQLTVQSKSGENPFSVVSSTGTGSTTLFKIIANGNVGIGTTTPSTTLHVFSTEDKPIFVLEDSDGACDYNPEAGGVTVSCTSDERVKKNIKDAGSVLGYLDTFRIRDYQLKATNDKKTSPIAQEVQKLHPELVKEGANGMLSLQEVESWKLVKAVQELNTKNKEQDKELTRLNSRISELETLAKTGRSKTDSRLLYGLLGSVIVLSVLVLKK